MVMVRIRFGVQFYMSEGDGEVEHRGELCLWLGLVLELGVW